MSFYKRAVRKIARHSPMCRNFLQNLTLEFIKEVCSRIKQGKLVKFFHCLNLYRMFKNKSFPNADIIIIVVLKNWAQ